MIEALVFTSVGLVTVWMFRNWCRREDAKWARMRAEDEVVVAPQCCCGHAPHCPGCPDDCDWPKVGFARSDPR